VRGLVASLAAAALLLASPARADGPEPTHEPSPKRAVPDYDGRGPQPAPDPALWPLRVVLSPLYFTSEFVLRRPIGAITREAEKHDIPEKVYDFFAFGPDHKIGFVPVGLVEFGFNPSVGIYGFWNDAFVPGNKLHIHYEVWPADWLSGVVDDRWQIDDAHAVELRVAGLHRPDMVFYGIGPESASFDVSRFSESRFETKLTYSQYVWRRSRFEAEAGVRKVDLSPGRYGSDPSLEVEARTGVFPIPFGFERGYFGPTARLFAQLDTRRRNTDAGSGIRLQAQADTGSDLEHAPATGWIRWGGVASVLVDLNDHGRVLSLTGAASFADPIGDQPIPFTELATLGGDQWLHGFFPGRLVDRSFAVAQLKYRWPVAPWLDGTIEGATGNVFGEHLAGFDAKLLRVSAGLGLTTRSELPIEVVVAFGTDTIDRGATVNSLRVSLGVPRGF